MVYAPWILSTGLLIYGLGITTPCSADTGLRGYLKSYIIGQQAIDNSLMQIEENFRSETSLRLIWQGSDKDSRQDQTLNYAWEIHYELSPMFSNQSFELGPFQKNHSPAYRLSDVEPLLNKAPQRSIRHNLDRLNIQLRLEQGDLTIGRQAITFGAARMINPTDVLLPYNLTALNTEYRIGVDAIRYQRPLGQLGEVDFGYVFGPGGQPESSVAFIHGKTNLVSTDLSFAALRFANQTLLGAGLQSALGDMGFWLETALVNGDLRYWRTSTGVDYNFSEAVFGMLEYHYNGAGTDQAKDYLSRLQAPPYQLGGVFLLGQHYLISSLNFHATPLTSVAMRASVNLQDRSSFLSLSMTYNIFNDLYLAVGLHRFDGKPPSGQYANPLTPSLLTTEYGASPDSVYAQLSYYF